MKFCPICGSPREKKEKCECGYDYSTNIYEKPFDGIKEVNNTIENHLCGAPLEELKRRKLDVGNLLSVSYTSSGGMMGSYHSVSLSFENNEVTSVDQEWHHGERIERKSKVSKEDVEEIKKIIIDNNFRAWSEIPEDRSMIIFDAPTSSMNLRFEDNSATISSRIYMDKEEQELYTKVIKMLYSLQKDDKKTEKKKLDLKSMMMGGQQDNDLTEKINNRKMFCPECGNVIDKGINECKCGFIVPEDKRD
jgi:hypothetical protein